MKTCREIWRGSTGKVMNMEKKLVEKGKIGWIYGREKAKKGKNHKNQNSIPTAAKDRHKKEWLNKSLGGNVGRTILFFNLVRRRSIRPGCRRR